MEQEKRRLQGELRGTGEEAGNLAREAQSLREQIQAEQARRREREAELTKQVEELERENKQLNMRLIKVQMQDSAKLTDVTMVKKEVVARTMELEKILREFQQTHQDNLFARVWGITSAMQGACQKPEVAVQIKTPVATEESLAPSPCDGAPIGADFHGLSAPGPTGAARVLASEAITKSAPSPCDSSPIGAAFHGFSSPAPAAPARASSPKAGGSRLQTVATAGASGTFLDPETQQALKRRLQALGDVVVYASDKFEACCSSGRAIPPNALRVRPRRCDHVFLVECLMPYWAEGLCPVCRCSFAYDRPQDAGFDESDKYSSVSTSVSQMHRRMPRSGSNSDVGSLRDPRPTRDFGGGGSEGRGRSASLSRAYRRRRSNDTRSEASGKGVGLGGRGAGDRLDRVSSFSPPRSVASLRSRAGSLPRDRDRVRDRDQDLDTDGRGGMPSTSSHGGGSPSSRPL